MNASNSAKLALRKPPKRRKVVKRMTARSRVRTVSAKQRADLRYAAKVRAACVERDPQCRLAGLLTPCSGDLAWCHMEGKRRHQTRRMKPEERHSTAWTVMLCAAHAELEERHQIRSEYLSARGADGPMLWSVPNHGPVIWELYEPGGAVREKATA